MFEVIVCSLVTILPDFLFRRYVQGKRIGYEITFFSVWYELRWGITLCAILTISLITLVFYYHPSTSAVTNYFRTVTILPETGGRVSEVMVANNQDVEAGQLLFRLDASSQRAAVNAAEQKIAEVAASQSVAAAQLAAAQGTVTEAAGALEQARDNLAREMELAQRGSTAARASEQERLENLVASREGSFAAAEAQVAAVEENINVLIPAQLASAQAALEQAEAELAKTDVHAGVAGRVEQFVLQPGDYVNPVLRPAGILVPADHLEKERYAAGFSQLAADVLHPGMFAEMGCFAKPFKVIPMVVAEVQNVIPSGQYRPTDVLRDPAQTGAPGSITVFLEPLYPGGAEGIPAGASCVANAYTYNHDLIEEGGLGFWKTVYLHVVDTVGLVHAILLWIQMLLMPVQSLVFTGGH
mgnify:CR=1 FL=1